MPMIGHTVGVRSGHHPVHASIRVGVPYQSSPCVDDSSNSWKVFYLRSFCVFQQSHKCVVVVGQSGRKCVKLNWVLILSSITNNET